MGVYSTYSKLQSISSSREYFTWSVLRQRWTHRVSVSMDSNKLPSTRHGICRFDLSAQTRSLVLLTEKYFISHQQRHCCKLAQKKACHVIRFLANLQMRCLVSSASNGTRSSRHRFLLIRVQSAESGKLDSNRSSKASMSIVRSNR